MYVTTTVHLNYAETKWLTVVVGYVWKRGTAIYVLMLQTLQYVYHNAY
jgi:hypothetical protein